MGIARTDETQSMEIEEFRRTLLSCAGMHRRKDKEDNNYSPGHGKASADKENGDDGQLRLVCITSAASFVGIAVVNQLLLRGYSVRAIVHNEEDLEKVREIQSLGEMRGTKNRVEAVIADLTKIENLLEAFNGCSGVFHTAAFVDPAGLSGYTKIMAEIEVKATKNVLEACAATPSVRHCLLTSSLLACIWQDNSTTGSSITVDHKSWSDESVCINKKLWYALGKLRAEKAAWEFAKERGLKLATICPGLITGSEFYNRNSTSTFAYLKGAGEMYLSGLLATVDVNRLAKAHVCVYEEMKKIEVGWRYICFDGKIDSQQDIDKLARETGLEINIERDSSINFPTRFRLSNLKLLELMHRTLRCNQ